MTKHSLTYCHKGTVQLQIQLMKQLQKPITKDSKTVKKKLGEVQHYLRYLRFEKFSSDQFRHMQKIKLLNAINKNTNRFPPMKMKKLPI